MPERQRPLLTPAQWLVLERLAQGDSNSAIAASLGIALGTVASHVRTIYQRVPQMPNGGKRAAAAAWYLTVGRALREQEAS